MAYWSTQTILETKILSSRLLNWGDKNRDGTLDTASLTQAFKAAQGLISGYITARYGSSVITTWTSSTVPWLIQDIYNVISLYWFVTGSNQISPSVQMMYDNAIKQLEAIRDNELDVFDETNETILTESSTGHMPIAIEPSDTNKVFTREGLGTPPSDYRPDVFQAVEDDDDDSETTG